MRNQKEIFALPYNKPLAQTIRHKTTRKRKNKEK
jgi:hypothetical protein